jgi:hypothetical protein
LSQFGSRPTALPLQRFAGKGLAVKCVVDQSAYEKGIKVSDKELAKVRIKLSAFHGEWNYTIAPTKAKIQRLLSSSALLLQVTGTERFKSF